MDQTVEQVFAAVPEPQLFESDISVIAEAMLTGFEAGYYAATGVPLTLGDADPRRYELLYQADLIAQSYAAGNWVSKQNLLKYAVGPNLDTLGSFWGDMGLRLQGTYAVCALTFSISAPSGTSVTIPTGTTASTTDGVYVFATLADATIIPGNLFVITDAQCTTLGLAPNKLPIGSITVLQNWGQPFVVTVTNQTVPSGGADLETDDRYRMRLYKLPKGLSTCGTRESYEYYALSANPSISEVAVHSEPGISGTVILTPLMLGGVLPTETELNQVLAACSGENNRPLADKVVAAAPSGHAYKIVISASLPESLAAQESTLLDNGHTAIETYITNEKQSLGGYIDPTDLTNTLSDIGFINVIVSQPTFAILQDNEQPVLTDDPVFTYGGLI